MFECKEIKIFDATLRDGSHAIKHQIELDFIHRYCSRIDECGLDTVIVGHGNGLGASSIQIGLSKYGDNEMLQTARNALKKTKLGVYMIPGFGTIKDNLLPAINIGVDVFKIGAHCTEADIMKEHIEYLASNNKEVYGVLMCSHMACNERLLEEAEKIYSYGACGVIFMDSAGALLPDDVFKIIDTVKKTLPFKAGFHAHNNLGLAIANTLSALKAGADIIDGTLFGFGAGAGNCRLEIIIAILQKFEILKNLSLYKIMDIADEFIKGEMQYTGSIDEISVISGISGVFSAFKNKVYEAALMYKIDPRDIFMELGRRKVVGGQEDMIIDAALYLSQKNNLLSKDYMMESLL